MGGDTVKWRQGFTLVETLVALMITAGMWLLVVGTERGLVAPLRRDAIAWYQVVRFLEQPGRYRFLAATGDVLTIQDQQAKHKQIKKLSVDSKQTLKLTDDHFRGYYPLLRHVTAIQWRPLKAGVVSLRLKQEGLPWQETLVDLRGIKDS